MNIWIPAFAGMTGWDGLGGGSIESPLPVLHGERAEGEGQSHDAMCADMTASLCHAQVAKFQTFAATTDRAALPYPSFVTLTHVRVQESRSEL